MKKFLTMMLGLLLAPALALAQPGPGPGPTPDPWIVNGSQIYYNQGCVSISATAPGACHGAGSVNADKLYTTGLATIGGTLTFPTPFTLGATSVTSTGTQLNYLSQATGTTGTATSNLVFSASPTFSGTVGGSNILPLTGFAQIATNTVLVNATSGTANVTAQNVVSCSTSTSALTWTTNTGFGCHTIATTPFLTYGANQTTSFTATANTNYPIDTLTTGAVSMTLPASPANGDMVGFIDIKRNFQNAALTVLRNGHPIMLLTQDMTVNTSGAAAILVYNTTGDNWSIQ